MSLAKIFGVHAAQAALDYAPKKIKQAWVDQKRQDERLMSLVKGLQKHNIRPEKADRKKLDNLSKGSNHQGIILEVEMPAMRSESDLKAVVESGKQIPFWLILDHVQDPQNLGACLRTADAAGVQGVIVTKDQAVGITPTVCKVASGAAETVPVYQVTNLSRTINWLKDQGIWIAGAAGEAEQTIYEMDANMPLALVMGAEEKGLRRLTREQCDFLVKIPMQGSVESLNVSVAAGVLIYEILRQRLKV
ncbi:23S rRNA (guanosine2251-2'-O)-methyltransferase [Bathymodiolus platifrons methanotrophic gill symbiont]|uniref:23S rRNA (guanosine(2251)-2'-O)-methyltransferase RlmB n=1 Tax=Bathymodiolus platifrons methanotrophic gill symbiont TaxID=113268 RepID=UPI000B41B87C|nr:23S rRNA (guanosine(2251)-2'-O)-methyltransferase RlmB [Bathymodiolus platifrons methanotrophic gill symbiont]TXK96805.1 23S rRNA (guanosine(2251)-2'-O)-methyltransferase RlmB [Methylococcaceae bacterium HT1]TXL17607.1 23S rRNA (guanosine(2251)-2'-O)-methyltransferase RlmB [Methylococcaceae bacterium HT3]TXL22763.1 23S rRNA (guanosine(2251)-2'-O)-methyltransferase RlmB [Methylococcaceae bacterium HT2]GAW86816.1 23S rRNA (guanosine2251-2'-O)-methyltransferase [Bathymodiolus platifrons methano